MGICLEREQKKLKRSEIIGVNFSFNTYNSSRTYGRVCGLKLFDRMKVRLLRMIRAAIGEGNRVHGSTHVTIQKMTLRPQSPIRVTPAFTLFSHVLDVVVDVPFRIPRTTIIPSKLIVGK